MFSDALRSRRYWSRPKIGGFWGCQHTTHPRKTIYTPFPALMIFLQAPDRQPWPFIRSTLTPICYKPAMLFDWNIDEIDELKKKADAHGENKSIKRHLERLEMHIEKYKACRSHELRKKVWETVEDEAMDLARVLDGLKKR